MCPKLVDGVAAVADANIINLSVMAAIFSWQLFQAHRSKTEVLDLEASSSCQEVSRPAFDPVWLTTC